MMLTKKIVVQLKVSKDLDAIQVVESLFRNNVKPDLVFLDMESSEFPDRSTSLPDGLMEFVCRNPKVKFIWDGKNPLEDDEAYEIIRTETQKRLPCDFVQKNSFSQNHEFIDMTMVSVFYDAGINPLRKEATKKAAACWMKQKHLPQEMMFVELGFNGEFTFSKEDFPKQINYIRIDGNDSHKYLFQKEHLWNIAAKRAKHEKLMFVDSDIAPLKDVDWFKQVYDQLDKCLFTQGFRMIQYLDKNDANMEQAKSSYNSSYMEKKRFMGVPGGVYCLQKNTLQMIGYFNYLPFGGGDDLFWSEIMGMDKRPYILFDTRRHVKDILEYQSQETGKPLLGNVSVNIVHFYHGDRAQRSYKHRHFVLMTQYPWKDSIITDDERGILMWVNMKHRFVDVIRHLPEMNDDIDRIQGFMSGIIDYRGFYEDFISVYNDKNKFQDKARVDIIRLIQSLIGKHEVKGTGSPFNFDVVVSFTSYLKRLCNDEIYLFLDSIMNQKCSKVKYHVVCTLFKGDYDKVPEKVLRYFVEHGIEVILCDDDWKSHKKYLYVMQKYRDYPVITVDDDAVYEDDMIESLYRDHMENPDMIVGRRIRKINFDLQGHATKYNSWQFVEGEKPSIDLFATTGGGTLFPPSFCKIIDKSTPDEINRTGTMSCDDFFMHYLAQKNGIMTKCVKYLNRKTKFFRGYMKKSLSMALDPGALWASNIKNNDDFVYLFDKRTGKEDDANGK